MIHTVKGFTIINETEVAVSLEFPCFLYDPTNLGNLISYSSAFSKLSLYIWKFLIQVLLKPSLKDFEHNLTSMGSEHKSLVVWTFFSIALLWNWDDRDFLLLGSRITVNGDCSHEIRRHFLFGRKAMTNLDRVWKSRDITLPTKVHIVKAVVSPVAMYGCES